MPTLSNPTYVYPPPDGANAVFAVIVVANQAARLALPQPVAIGRAVTQEDTGATYVLKPSGVPSNNADWSVFPIHPGCVRFDVEMDLSVDDKKTGINNLGAVSSGDVSSVWGYGKIAKFDLAAIVISGHESLDQRFEKAVALSGGKPVFGNYPVPVSGVASNIVFDGETGLWKLAYWFMGEQTGYFLTDDEGCALPSDSSGWTGYGGFAGQVLDGTLFSAEKTLAGALLPLQTAGPVDFLLLRNQDTGDVRKLVLKGTGDSETLDWVAYP